MCLAIPSRVVSVDGGVAVVECFGQRRSASLVLLDEPVREGDYLLVQAGGLAFEVVEPQRAQAALAALGERLALDELELRRW